MKNCSCCGRINDDDALFCCKCGRAFNENEVESFNPIADAMMHYDEVVASPKQKRLCCPKCKSNHLQAIVETATSARTIGNGYSPAKGCLGSLLLGSGGWLLGALGQRQRTIIETQNRNYWICNDCGNKFRNTEEWHEEIKKKEQAGKVNLVLTIFFIIVAMLLFTGGEVSSVVGIVFLIIGAVNAITFFILPEEKQDFHNFVSKIRAGGGGDEPESGLEALALALRSDFVKEGKKKRHIIVLFTDASAHEFEQQKDGVPNNYPVKMYRNLGDLYQTWGTGQDALGVSSDFSAQMSKDAKRLVLFAPSLYPWNEMELDLENVIRKDMDKGNGGRDLDLDDVIALIANSIA